MSAADTIFACASGSGKAGVAVLRISGASAARVFEALTDQPQPKPRRATLRRLLDPSDGGLLDEALVLWFPEPGSFTGEDVVELHVHGGPAVVSGVASALAQLQGFRPAEAGEFTRRAFRSGKLDLAEAEGLGDLIEADSAAARRQALWQMGGGLSALYADWRERLAVRLAFAEASLDFSDEPLPETLETANADAIRGLREELESYLSVARPTERMRDGLYVALIGAPNVGKSSILNALARRPAAIVTDQPGTTRDVMEVRLELEGYPLLIADTAGLRDSEDVVEIEGMRRARAAAAHADLALYVADCRDWPAPPQLATDKATDSLIFWNKRDLTDKPIHDGPITGSALTGVGLSALEARLAEAAAKAFDSGPPPAITQARHRIALTDCVEALRRWEQAPAPELAAEDIRLAMRALGRVVGIIDVEDVLDRIFSAFCIGK